MNIRCYVIDDEPDAIGLLKDYIEKTPGLELCGSADNPLEALDFLTGLDAPDVTFLDVDMPQLSGLEVAGLVNLYTTVVFTTAFADYAVQAFEKEAFDYLVKPIDYERFLRSVQRIKRERLRQAQAAGLPAQDYFTVKSEIKGRLIKIRYDEVVYIESAVNYIQIHTTAAKHMTYLKITEIEQHLPVKMFSRLHRSFIVNVNFVRTIERNRVILEDGRDLPLGDHYKKDFLDGMDDNLLKSERTP